MAKAKRNVSESVTLLASTAQTVTSTGEAAVTLPDEMKSVVFTLDVSAGGTESGDLLDVFIQTKLDDTNWTDIVHFTQVLGDAAVKRFIAKVDASLAQAMFETGTALGAAAVRNLLGNEYRVRFTIVDAATTGNASFTFSVVAVPA